VLVLLRLPAWWNDFIAGLVLLAVLVFDGRLRQALEKNLRRQKYSRFLTASPPLQKKPVERKSQPSKNTSRRLSTGKKSGVM